MVIKVFEQYIGNIRDVYKNIEIATFTFDVQSCNIFHLHHSNCRKRLRNDSWNFLHLWETNKKQSQN